MLNKSSILRFEIISTIFIMIIGTLLHFTYEWSNNNPIIGIVSAINESTWEHLKLIFFPMLIFTIIGYFYKGKNISNYLCAKLVGIIAAILFVIVFFYTYTGIIGTNFAVIDIATFFVAVFLGQYVSYKQIDKIKFCNKLIPAIILIILCFCFLFFTFFPPKIQLFQDPIQWQI